MLSAIIGRIERLFGMGLAGLLAAVLLGFWLAPARAGLMGLGLLFGLWLVVLGAVGLRLWGRVVARQRAYAT